MCLEVTIFFYAKHCDGNCTLAWPKDQSGVWPKHNTWISWCEAAGRGGQPCGINQRTRSSSKRIKVPIPCPKHLFKKIDKVGLKDEWNTFLFSFPEGLESAQGSSSVRNKQPISPYKSLNLDKEVAFQTRQWFYDRLIVPLQAPYSQKINNWCTRYFMRDGGQMTEAERRKMEAESKEAMKGHYEILEELKNELRTTACQNFQQLPDFTRPDSRQFPQRLRLYFWCGMHPLDQAENARINAATQARENERREAQHYVAQLAAAQDPNSALQITANIGPLSVVDTKRARDPYAPIHAPYLRGLQPPPVAQEPLGSNVPTPTQESYNAATLRQQNYGVQSYGQQPYGQQTSRGESSSGQSSSRKHRRR
ncbi:hypothetical protein QBC43DRAFT_334243 [Cladorrhinum sp. PSN259]|nr:hypothetical protein QBC43DRAFT_334243 [Cladorrhinum sp. PSN259]